MSVQNARARLGSGGRSRDYDEPIRLPQADPWDRQTGLQPVAEFEVQCTWINLDKDWATIQPFINLDGELYPLSQQVDVRRIYRELRGQQVEGSELIALAWTKKALGSGGVAVLECAEANPGHIGVDLARDKAVYRWMATVGSRLSVALVKLHGGSIEGHARLVPVE